MFIFHFALVNDKLALQNAPIFHGAIYLLIFHFSIVILIINFSVSFSNILFQISLSTTSNSEFPTPAMLQTNLIYKYIFFFKTKYFTSNFVENLLIFDFLPVILLFKYFFMKVYILNR